MQRVTGIEQRISEYLPAEVRVWRCRGEDASAGARRLLQPALRWLGLTMLARRPIRGAQVDHSLTHAGDCAYALAVRAPGVIGVGIDYEPWRALDARHARLMLTRREQQQLPAAGSRDWLRIWTVKEACYKADRDGQQRWVTAYELVQPSRRHGTARILQGNRYHFFRYLSLEVPGGLLSIAFKMEFPQ